MLVILRYNRYNANFDVKFYISVTPVRYYVHGCCCCGGGCASSRDDERHLLTSSARMY